MTVSSYLTRIARDAIIRDSEKESIKRSIEHMSRKIRAHFGDDVSDKFLFGSYTRDTILPRGMDQQSDIDYMVVFKENFYRPQTYLTRLKTFAENNYNRSEVRSSHPTIQLELNHIRFELVPATRGMFLGGLLIPGKASSYQDWISTDPNDFNKILTDANKRHNYLMKPLIRLVKYWNASNGYPYESYELEQMIINHNYGIPFFLGAPDLKDYLFSFVENGMNTWFMAQWKVDKINRARQVIGNVRSYERTGRIADAEREVKKLIPDTANAYA